MSFMLTILASTRLSNWSFYKWNASLVDVRKILLIKISFFQQSQPWSGTRLGDTSRSSWWAFVGWTEATSCHLSCPCAESTDFAAWKPCRKKASNSELGFQGDVLGCLLVEGTRFEWRFWKTWCSTNRLSNKGQVYMVERWIMFSLMTHNFCLIWHFEKGTCFKTPVNHWIICFAQALGWSCLDQIQVDLERCRVVLLREKRKMKRFGKKVLCENVRKFVLLWDAQATSALDSQSERLVQKALEAIRAILHRRFEEIRRKHVVPSAFGCCRFLHFKYQVCKSVSFNVFLFLARARRQQSKVEHQWCLGTTTKRQVNIDDIRPLVKQPLHAPNATDTLATTHFAKQLQCTPLTPRVVVVENQFFWVPDNAIESTCTQAIAHRLSTIEDWSLTKIIIDQIDQIHHLHLFTNSFHGLLQVPQSEPPIDPILRLFGDSKGDVGSMYEALVPLKGHESMQRTIDFKRVETNHRISALSMKLVPQINKPGTKDVCYYGILWLHLRLHV